MFALEHEHDYEFQAGAKEAVWDVGAGEHVHASTGGDGALPPCHKCASQRQTVAGRVGARDYCAPLPPLSPTRMK